MLYIDHKGTIMHPEEVEELSPHEIQERGFRVFDDRRYAEI